MNSHHDGALEMVKDLKEQPGSAYDPVLNEFVSDIVNDQSVEIERMNSLLIGLSNDPRAGLAAGLYDAEEAILNLELFEAQRKPIGFYDPNNPAGGGVKKTKKTKDINEDESENKNRIANRKSKMKHVFLWI